MQSQRNARSEYFYILDKFGIGFKLAFGVFDLIYRLGFVDKLKECGISGCFRAFL
jgi:hypothetical protein